MSNAICEIMNEDLVTIGYGEYAGSSDIMAPEFVGKSDEVWPDGKAYQLRGWDKLRNCNHKRLKVICYTYYGGGFWWPSEACLECKVITGRLSPYEPDYGYAMPSEKVRHEEEKWRSEGWPRNGDPRVFKWD